MPDVIFNGPEGRLEGRYHQSEQKNAPTAIVLHPNPLHGGTMNNKVAYNLYHSFVRNGFSVLRFNFRGVGRSQGKFDHGVGELTDAATALDWAQMQNPDASAYWVSGFSFGAWVAMQLLMRRPEIEGFVAISPPVNIYDFSFLTPCPASGLIIQGDNDSVVSEESVSKLNDKLAKQRNISVDYRVVPGADHFFRETMDQMNAHIDDYLTHSLQERRKPRKIKPDRRRRQLSAV